MLVHEQHLLRGNPAPTHTHFLCTTACGSHSQQFLETLRQVPEPVKWEPWQNAERREAVFE